MAAYPTKPLVTVLMTVYNVEQYLREAIDSILNQTYTDFIFLIINDCSQDNSEEVIKSYTDPRIQYFKNEKNLGLTGALNVGVRMIDTKYIIRMDADDISVLNRFEILVNFMESHADVGVFSSGLQRFGADNSKWQFPQNNDDIKANLLFGPCIAHAPAIIRTAVMKDTNIYYRELYKQMEDYDLWYRLLPYTNFANIHDILYMYRIATHNYTVMNPEAGLDRKKAIYQWILETFGIDPTEEELLLHISLNYKIKEDITDKVTKTRVWLDKLIALNLKNNYFPHAALLKQIDTRWNQLFFTLPAKSNKSVFTFIKLNKGISFIQWSYLGKFMVNKMLGRKK